jgi:hypothetical protein
MQHTPFIYDSYIFIHFIQRKQTWTQSLHRQLQLPLLPPDSVYSVLTHCMDEIILPSKTQNKLR